MLGRFGETLVVDWGIAKPFADPAGEAADGSAIDPPADDSSLTRPGSAIGTPQYMSPEQALGELDRVGPASDVYSLGATLYCLLVGHGPFSTGGVADVLQRVSRGIFPAPRRLRRSIDPALEALCLKAMALQPEDRLATPLALAEGIEAWMADVRYRGEQEQATHDVKRSLARLCIERAHNLFGRELHGEGMLWLARALENVPTGLPGPRPRRPGEPGRLACRGEADGTHPLARRRRPRRGVQPRRAEPRDRVRGSAGTALGPRQGHAALGTDEPRRGWSTRSRSTRTGRMIATVSLDGALRRWDAVTGTSIGVAIRHEAPVTAVRFSPDGSTIATASRADLPCLWDATTGRSIDGTSPAGHDAQVLDIAFHPDGTLLAAAGNDGRVWFRETATGRLLDATLRHEAAVPAADVPPGRPDAPHRLPRRPCPALGPHRMDPPGGVPSSGRGRLRRRQPRGRVGRDGLPRRHRPALGHRLGQTDRRAAGAPGAGRLRCVQPRRLDGRDGEPGRVRPALGCRHRPADRPAPGTSRRRLPALAFSPDGRRLATACSDGHGAMLASPRSHPRSRRADRLLGPRRDRARIRRGRRDPSHGPTGRLGASPPPSGTGRAARQVRPSRSARVSDPAEGLHRERNRDPNERQPTLRPLQHVLPRAGINPGSGTSRCSSCSSRSRWPTSRTSACMSRPSSPWPRGASHCMGSSAGSAGGSPVVGSRHASGRCCCSSSMRSPWALFFLVATVIYLTIEYLYRSGRL